jgi:hypothetical protein
MAGSLRVSSSLTARSLRVSTLPYENAIQAAVPSGSTFSTVSEPASIQNISGVPKDLPSSPW